MSKRSKQRLSPYQYAPYGSDNLVYSKDFQSVMTSSYTQLNKDVFRRTVNHGKQQRLHLRERSTKLEPPYNIQASLKERDQRQVYTHWWKQRGRPSSTRPESMVAEDAAREKDRLQFFLERRRRSGPNATMNSPRRRRPATANPLSSAEYKPHKTTQAPPQIIAAIKKELGLSVGPMTVKKAAWADEPQVVTSVSAGPETTTETVILED